MRQSWRLLIAWLSLVLLPLPLQGFAVAGKLSCTMDMPAQLGITVASDNEHCQPVAKADGATTEVMKGKIGDHCKSSSLCCMGIALMPAISISAFVPMHDDAQVLPVLLPASVPARMLERPPKAAQSTNTSPIWRKYTSYRKDFMSHIHYLYLLPALLVMTGSASFNIDQSTQKINQQYLAYAQGKLALASKPAQQKNRRDQAGLLRETLSQDAAVQIALLNSPALQAMLAQHKADGADTGQEVRIQNSLFNFERSRQSGELEIARMLSLGLLDLLSLPQRQTRTHAQGGQFQ